MKLKLPHLNQSEEHKLRYLLVGVWNTCLGILTFFVLYQLFHAKLHYLFISVLSHFIAVFNAWYMYRRLVFKSTASPIPEYLRFNISSLIVLALQVCGLWILVDFFQLDPIFSQIIIVIMIVILGYLIHTKFTFNRFFSKN